MASTVAQKLRIREGSTLRTLHAPAGFAAALGPLPEGVRIAKNGKLFDQLHWFVQSRAGMEEDLPGVLELLQPGVVCWIYYPKGSSGIQTDLTRDKGWDALLAHKLHWLSLISFDATWSAFGMRLPTEADSRKTVELKPRAVFDHIDPVKKLVFLPDDLAEALHAAPAEAAFYESLSFTSRKEYLEWVVSAKRPETRATRVLETVERLKNGWKNPANR
jgi:hypothetical protein